MFINIIQTVIIFIINMKQFRINWEEKLNERFIRSDGLWEFFSCIFLLILIDTWRPNLKTASTVMGFWHGEQSKDWIEHLYSDSFLSPLKHRCDVTCCFKCLLLWLPGSYRLNPRKPFFPKPLLWGSYSLEAEVLNHLLLINLDPEQDNFLIFFFLYFNLYNLFVRSSAILCLIGTLIFLLEFIKWGM